MSKFAFEGITLEVVVVEVARMTHYCTWYVTNGRDWTD